MLHLWLIIGTILKTVLGRDLQIFYSYYIMWIVLLLGAPLTPQQNYLRADIIDGLQLSIVAPVFKTFQIFWIIIAFECKGGRIFR